MSGRKSGCIALALSLAWLGAAASLLASPSDSSKREKRAAPGQSTGKATPPRIRRSAPPSFQNLRYREDWEGTSRAGDFWSRAKYLPFGPEGFFLSLGGQLRLRSEFWDGFGFDRSQDDTFGLLRLRLHSDLHLGPHLRLFLEGKSALADGRQLPGGSRTLDSDAAALQNAFLDLTSSFSGGSFTLRAGRQELQFGRQRLVSPLDWSNTRPRMFDGFRAILRLRNWRMDAFWTRFVRLRKYAFNNHDSGTDFFGLNTSGKVGRVVVENYWLARRSTRLREMRHTLGSRLKTPLPRGWDLEGEGAIQFGNRANRTIRAYMISTEVGHTFRDLRWRPRLYGGFDYASGDRDPGDARQSTFDHLFPLGHAYFGYIDAVGRQNIVDLPHGLALAPWRQARLAFGGHAFWRARRADALYNAGGKVLRAGAPGTPKWVGYEMDWTLGYSLDRHTRVVGGYSHFFPGAFLAQTGSDDPTNFGYLTVQYTF